MRNKISAAVVHHKDRPEVIEPLIKSLGPDTKVFTSIMEKYNTEINDVVETSMKAWEAYDPTAEYHLVVEDDVILCNNFYENLDFILIDPARIYNLHWRQRPVPMYARKSGFVLANERVSIPTLAVCIPTALIPDLLVHAKADKGWMDIRIVNWAHDRGIMIYYPIPCLVQHNVAIKSLVMGYMAPDRKSHCFVDDYANRDYDAS